MSTDQQAFEAAEDIWLRQIQGQAFTDAVTELATRHEAPEISAMLGIDPDSPEHLAATVLNAARPIVVAILEKLAAELAAAGLAPGSSYEQWAWATDGWTAAQPETFFQPMTAGHDPFTEQDVRDNIARIGGTAVVRTVFSPIAPTPWKDVP